MDRAFTDARAHGWSRRPIVEMLIPSLVDDSLAPPGQYVASLFCQHFDPAIPGGWEAHRDAAVATLFDTVEAAAPGFRHSVIGHSPPVPVDLEARFVLTGGHHSTAERRGCKGGSSCGRS